MNAKMNPNEANQFVDIPLDKTNMIADIIRFPPNCEVLHFYNNYKKANFAKVECIATNIVTLKAKYWYKITSHSEVDTATSSSYQQDFELAFAPQTTVWALVHDKEYIPAVVLAALPPSLKQKDKLFQYSVISPQSQDIFHGIINLKFRGSEINPPQHLNKKTEKSSQKLQDMNSNNDNSCKVRVKMEAVKMEPITITTPASKTQKQKHAVTQEDNASHVSETKKRKRKQNENSTESTRSEHYIKEEFVEEPVEAQEIVYDSNSASFSSNLQNDSKNKEALGNLESDECNRREKRPTSSSRRDGRENTRGRDRTAASSSYQGDHDYRDKEGRNNGRRYRNRGTQEVVRGYEDRYDVRQNESFDSRRRADRHHYDDYSESSDERYRRRDNYSESSDERHRRRDNHDDNYYSRRTESSYERYGRSNKNHDDNYYGRSSSEISQQYYRPEESRRRDEKAYDYYHTKEPKHVPSSTGIVLEKVINLPSGLDFPIIREEILSRRKVIMQQNQCTAIALSDDLLKGGGEEYAIQIVGSTYEGVEEAQRLLFEIVVKSVPEEERGLCMYDIAFCNPKEIKVDGALAFNYIPTDSLFQQKKWIGVVNLTNQQVAAAEDWFCSRDGVCYRDDKKKYYDCDILLCCHKSSPRPHILVFTHDAQRAVAIRDEVQKLVRNTKASKSSVSRNYTTSQQRRCDPTARSQNWKEQNGNLRSRGPTARSQKWKEENQNNFGLL